MSQERENANQTENLPDEGKQALSTLRAIWSAKNQTSAAIDEACGNTKSCRNMETVGFQGLLDDVGMSPTSDQSVSGNMRAAWKTKLEREGKLSGNTGSLRDLVFGEKDTK